MNTSLQEDTGEEKRDFVWEFVNYLFYESRIFNTDMFNILNAMEPLIESEYERGRTKVLPVSKVDLAWMKSTFKGGQHETDLLVDIEKYEQRKHKMKQRLAAMECEKFGKASFDPDSPYDEGWIAVAMKQFPDVDLFEGID